MSQELLAGFIIGFLVMFVVSSILTRIYLAKKGVEDGQRD
jgi:multisubunit Na+/H+ antiporter MnhE subunit